jgi:hypothetical protein
LQLAHRRPHLVQERDGDIGLITTLRQITPEGL